MQMIIRSTILFTIMIVSNLSIAQDETSGKTLNELNSAYIGFYKFSINKEYQLAVDFYNSSGHYRQDIVYLDYLDPDMITYNIAEKAISIRCSINGEKCIDKEIFKLDVIRHASRINIHEKDVDRAERAIQHLQSIISAHLKREIELGETRTKR